MRKLLVATHERFASGIMETFKLIMGENEDISEISAYVEPGEKLVRYNNSNAFTWGEFIPYIVERMLEVGMLKPLTQKQKKAVFTVVAIDCR